MRSGFDEEPQSLSSKTKPASLVCVRPGLRPFSKLCWKVESFAKKQKNELGSSHGAVKMIEYLVINVCLGSDSLCQGWLKQNCKKKKKKYRSFNNNNNRAKHSSCLRPRFQFSFGTKINTHAATAGSTTRYVITSEIVRSRLSGQWGFRGEGSHGRRKERRLIQGAGAQLRLVMLGEMGKAGRSEHSAGTGTYRVWRMAGAHRW